jgi:adenylate kinase
MSVFASPGLPPDFVRYKTILLFGAPGSGKGTVGKSLGAIPGFVHCACGDVFRTLDLSTPIGRSFLEFSSQGLLVPDEITIDLWKESIDGLIATHRFVPERDTLILDGIPRNEPQTRILDAYLNVQRVFHLVCDDEKLMFQRLRRRALKDNRLDDASETVIRRRWEVYEEESQPVLDHYPAALIERVNAAGTPVEVIHRILGSLLTL